ncbi:LysR family transcriptional regulator [Streptomyces sp. PTM05]|uniref:LysR family transcriptional regulator n=1 Tax=Streptantibioticus parmotrematis TaxID=2873249 RepID=A0ABS7QMZ9_9ACTN|nr:LysR family transcriptional regulator [Streptantibioticus parmotrematis]MBY8884561.1 LysR family transcriptional regulator [Streptantibioticus parmotrematis]
MELRQLEYFTAVAEEMHFGRAAERLHIGQPAVSQLIRRLERELGVELFDRSPRHVRLTPAGASLLPQARAVLAAADRARAAVAEHLAERAATLRVGTSNGMGGHLDAVLDAFAALAPDTAVELAYVPTAERLAQVADGRLDAAFVRGEQEESDGVRVVPVWQEPLVAVVPASHPLAARGELPIAELAPLPLRLTARRNNPPLVDLVVAACRDAGFEPIPGPSTASLQDTLAAIGSGTAMWTVVYAAHAERMVAPKVAFVPFAAPGPTITTGLVLHRTRPPRRTRQLLEACGRARDEAGAGDHTR